MTSPIGGPSMLLLRFRTLMILAALVTAAGTAAAETKLDPRARVALAGIRSGSPISRLRENLAAVNTVGQLDVFIEGNVSRGELEANGAIVRSEAPGIFTAFIPVDRVDAIAA